LTESTSPGRRAWVITGVVLLIGIFWLRLALSVHRNSFTWDEDDHIYSGYMSWKHGPVAFAIKSSLSFLILLLLTIRAMGARKFTAWREILFLTIPPAFYLFVDMVAGMNIGLRHILPMYAFLTVLIGGTAWALIQANRAGCSPSPCF
jgi:hypothetical protein